LTFYVSRLAMTGQPDMKCSFTRS